MFDKIKKLPFGWLIVISLLGYIAYTDYMNDVRYVKHREEVQLFMNDVNDKLGRDMEQRIYKTSNLLVDGAINKVEKNNSLYLTKIDSILSLHESRRKELRSLLRDKINFYGAKIDYFENSLDSTMESHISTLDASFITRDDLIRQQISSLNDKLSEVDSMMYKLQTNWLTKGAFK